MCVQISGFVHIFIKLPNAQFATEFAKCALLIEPVIRNELATSTSHSTSVNEPLSTRTLHEKTFAKIADEILWSIHTAIFRPQTYV